MIESAKLVSVMKNDYVKLHSLYIEKGTKMAEEYEKGMFEICSVEEYKERVKLFLEYISPTIWVQRLLGSERRAYILGVSEIRTAEIS